MIGRDVGARGRFENAEAVVDDVAAGLHLALELVERGLVEHDAGIVGAENGRGDLFIAHDNGHVGRAAALLRPVSRHPRHFLSLHKCGIGQDFAH